MLKLLQGNGTTTFVTSMIEPPRVQAEFVTEAEHSKWSSAHDYAGGKGGLIDVIFMN